MRSSPGNEWDPAAGGERAAGDPADVTAPEEAPSGAEPSEDSTHELRAQLDETRSRLEVAEDRHLRARADLENYRKRAEGELSRRALLQRDDVLRGWLEVVDSVERAVGLEAEHPEVVRGLRAVLEQMDAVLARHGVTRVGAVGERFDPELHEATAVVRSRDHPEGTIVDVVRSGYAVDGRVLRPAQVAVAGRPADT